MLRFFLVTLFPEYFDGPLKASLLGRAIESGQVSVEIINLRDFGQGKYRAVDDKPFGGGPGMLLSAEVLEKALASICEKLGISLDAVESKSESAPHVIALTPQGTKLSAEWARTNAEIWKSSSRAVVLICGHYEGFDECFLEALVHEEISIGDYVLTGGEPAAAVLLDSLSRFVPNVVGDEASVAQDTFEREHEGGLKYPHYTRPAVWRGRAVPEVLTSGDHGKIAKWRKAQSLERTSKRRPDLKK